MEYVLFWSSHIKKYKDGDDPLLDKHNDKLFGASSLLGKEEQL